MNAWLVRFVSLYAFNVVVLLVVGWVMPFVSVGWHALWASVILTAATIWLKPLLAKAFRGAATSLARRAGLAEKLVQYGAVYVVELVVWMLTVGFSGVDVRGWLWGYVIPPLLLLVAWVVYDQVDDTLERRAAALFGGTRGRDGGSATQAAPPTTATRIGERELKDGLTDEQRRLLDEL